MFGFSVVVLVGCGWVIRACLALVVWVRLIVVLV